MPRPTTDFFSSALRSASSFLLESSSSAVWARSVLSGTAAGGGGGLLAADGCCSPSRSSSVFSTLVSRAISCDFRPDAGRVSSVVAYEVYISFSCHIQFCLLLNQNFEKNVQDPADPAEPSIQNPSSFCRFSCGSNHYIKEIPCSITHCSMDNHAQYSEAPYIILPELTFKGKIPQGMEHVCLKHCQ